MGQKVCGGAANPSPPQRPQGAPSSAASRPPSSQHSSKSKEKPKPQPKRAACAALSRVQCAERPFPGSEDNYPVKVVVFDLDETLTLTTFMSRDGNYTPEQHELTAKVNFESPWINNGSRIAKMKSLFSELIDGKDGQKRHLAILTRNDNAGGVMAVLNLLKVAKLEPHFAAIWGMPWRQKQPNGLYFNNGKWVPFNPPVNKVRDHKAHVLRHIAENMAVWFPQLEGTATEEELKIQPQGIVLVDDQRTNFTSDTGCKVLRYCKVARYDDKFYDFGMMKDMGGIGAKDDTDWHTLKSFVESPWTYKEMFKARCAEISHAHAKDKNPVALVVFDFDETLTMATFMPDDTGEEGVFERIGWKPKDEEDCTWTEEEIVKYNFESPWTENRLAKLKALLAGITGKDKDGKPQRALAVLAQNETGAVGVLNMLMIAGLADYFSAVWARSEEFTGAYREGKEWKSFDAPINESGMERNSELLKHVRDNPARWFPQMTKDAALSKTLQNMGTESIVLVDDERPDFFATRSADDDQSDTFCYEECAVVRYCKVCRYDDTYRECGFMSEMGGLGAHDPEDYSCLQKFIDAPWECADYTEVDVPDVAPTDEEGGGLREDMFKKVPTMNRQRVDSNVSLPSGDEAGRGRNRFVTGSGGVRKARTDGTEPKRSEGRKAKTLAASPSQKRGSETAESALAAALKQQCNVDDSAKLAHTA